VTLSNPMGVNGETPSISSCSAQSCVMPSLVSYTRAFGSVIVFTVWFVPCTLVVIGP
jgi:hypothetical protein